MSFWGGISFVPLCQGYPDATGCFRPNRLRRHQGSPGSVDYYFLFRQAQRPGSFFDPSSFTPPKAIGSIIVSSIPSMSAGVLDEFAVFVIDPVHFLSNHMGALSKQFQLLAVRPVRFPFSIRLAFCQHYAPVLYQPCL
jgi:hypothetical protein